MGFPYFIEIQPQLQSKVTTKNDKLGGQGLVITSFKKPLKPAVLTITK
jgi:hypothetical protein